MSTDQSQQTLAVNGKTGFSHEQVMASISDKIHSFKTTKEILSSLRAELAEVFNCEMVTFFSLDRENRTLYSHNFNPAEKVDIKVSISTDTLAGFVAATGRSLNIADAYSSEELAQYHPNLKHGAIWDEMYDTRTKSLIVTPLPHNKKLMGVMEIINKKGEEKFSEEDFRMAKTIAHMVGLLQAKLAFEEMEQNKSAKTRIYNTDLVHNISQSLHAAKDVDQILMRVKDDILELFDAMHVTIYAVDDNKNELYSKARSGESVREIRVPISGNSIAGCVAMQQRMVNIENVRDPEELKRYHPDMRFNEDMDRETEGDSKSMLVFPLVHKGNLLGALQVINKKNGGCFDGIDEKNAFIIAEVMALSFYNQRKFVKPSPTKFGYLFEQGIVTKRELVSAITKARAMGVDLEMVLENEGVPRQDIGKSLEKFYDLPYLTPSESTLIPDLDGLDIKSMYENYWVPLKIEDAEVLVLMNSPTNTTLAQEIQQSFAGKKISFKIGLKSDILDYLDSAPKKDGGEATAEPVPEERAIEPLFPLESTPVVPDIQPDIPQEEVPDVVESTPVQETIVKTSDKDEKPVTPELSASALEQIKNVVSEAHEQCVSKIHIEWAGENLKIRFRKKGVCRLYEEVPRHLNESVVSCLKQMADLRAGEGVLPQYGKTRLVTDASSFELQIATFPTVEGKEDVVITLLATGKQKPKLIPLANINISKANRELIESAIVKPHGLVLVCGAEGSGKTTLLHSFLQFINSPEKKILTVENPVEIRQEGLRQIQFDLSKGLTFAYALRAIMLGDPDVIMTGEIPDIETCQMALDAAQEHLVLCSTGNATPHDAIKGLLSMGADPAKLSGLLVIRQKFIETLCPDCKAEYNPSREEFDRLVEEYGATKFAELKINHNGKLTLKKPAGCKQCIYSGYKGRTGLQEIMTASSEILSLAQQGAGEDKIRNKAIEGGMTTLKQDGILKIFQGVCDLKQVLEICKTP